jgi:hypothetical protein
MKTFLLVVAALLLSTPTFANVDNVPSLWVHSQWYEHTFTNKSCVDHAVAVLTFIKNDGASALEISPPSDSGVYANDPELALDIHCIDKTKTVVFIAGSSTYRASELHKILHQIANKFNEAKAWGGNK